MSSRLARAVAVAAALVLLTMVTGCSTSYTAPPATGGATGGTTGGAAGGATITEQNITFNPSTLTVKVGETVTFKNADSVPHDVVVGTKDLGEQQPGQDVTWTADKAGTIDFKCIIHPSMTGQITVQ
jgi:plastocyanin